MKILITGASGMLGQNLVASLANLPHIDLLIPNRAQLDLMSHEAVSHYIVLNKPDLIIHAAARVGGIQANIKNPTEFFIENIEIGLSVIRAAQQAGVKRLLNIGSSCMYPRDLGVLSESCLLNGKLEPTNEGYALAKISISKLCEYISSQDGVSYKTIIPCNLYGEGDNFNLETGHLIPSIIHKLYLARLNGAPEVSIWGDGTARREFMYVGDLVNFILTSLNYFDELPQYLNVGVGKDYSINEYYEAVGSVVNYQGKFVHDLNKPVGMKQKLLDVGMAREWGWSANTDLESGIKKTYEYFLSKLASS